MKTKTVLLLGFLLGFPLLTFTQICAPEALQMQSGNQVAAMITNGGDLFWDGNSNHFYVPLSAEDPVQTIYAGGLWLAGYDVQGQLKTSTQSYQRSNNEFEFSPGPLYPPSGTPYVDNCEHYNRFWNVKRADIESHILDWEADGVIDNPIASVYAWPANGNAFFQTYNDFFLPENPQGWAFFYDRNENGVYNPDQGEYPLPSAQIIHTLIPEELNWCVFNDTHLNISGLNLGMKLEIQLTSWSFDCNDNYTLRNSIFTSHKIINRSRLPLHDFRIGLWVDFDLGCPTDDYMGCAPEKDGFFAYNGDQTDGDPSGCLGIAGYDNDPPVQSVVFLNRSLDYFSVFNRPPGILPPPQDIYFPNAPIEFYRYMNGQWADGTPYTPSGTGYNSGSTEPGVNHAFPGDPNEPGTWSMYGENADYGDKITAGATVLDTFSSGQVARLDIAYGHVQAPSLNHLEQVPRAYKMMDQLHFMYEENFNGYCDGIVGEVLSSTHTLDASDIQIYPNPSDGSFILKADKWEINGLSLYDLSGKLIYENKLKFLVSKNLEFDYLQAGLYLLRIETTQGVVTKKIVVQP